MALRGRRKAVQPLKATSVRAIGKNRSSLREAREKAHVAGRAGHAGKKVLNPVTQLLGSELKLWPRAKGELRSPIESLGNVLLGHPSGRKEKGAGRKQLTLGSDPGGEYCERVCVHGSYIGFPLAWLGKTPRKPPSRV